MITKEQIIAQLSTIAKQPSVAQVYDRPGWPLLQDGHQSLRLVETAVDNHYMIRAISNTNEVAMSFIGLEGVAAIAEDLIYWFQEHK